MRDGFQFETVSIPTDIKIKTLNGLVAAGLQRIQVTSFVHPKWVPQMSDAETLCAHLPNPTDVVFSALALNVRGVVRANNAGIKHIDLSISTNDKHSRDNANMSREDAIDQALEMIELAHSYGMNVQMGLQCVFGYREPGDTPTDRLMATIERFTGLDLDSFSLADSTGMANPKLIDRLLPAIKDMLHPVPLVMHFHDTRGLGLTNVYAALAHGITHFDTSFGGLGGCPFIPGATGNIATEDTVYLMNALGIETGIDPVKLSVATDAVSKHLGRELPGKLYKLISEAVESS